TLNFRNTNASAASASVNLDFSNLTVASTATAVVQKQYVNFKDSTTYNLNADKMYLGWNGDKYASNLSYITIDSGAKVKWSGSEFLIRQNGTMTVNGEFVRTGGGKVHLNAAGAVLNINDGAKFRATAPGKFIMEAGTTMNIGTNCTVEFVGGDQITLLGTVNTKSALSFKLLTTAGTLNQTAGGTTFTRSSTFNSGANWTIYDKIILEGGGSSEALLSKLIVNDGAAITVTQDNARVIFQGNADLILNTANAIKKTNDAGVTLVTYSGRVNNKVHVYADQLFDRVYVNNSDLSMYLYNDAVVRFTPAQFDSFSANNAYLKIFNFEEDSIYFDYTESIAAVVNNYVKLYSGETEETFLGMGILGTDGWVTLVVPEPATYAALFGLLALGFAAYRRRK
ncbi:MAG: PEP-CTERM sorting domain-containing protein, partial [Opitutales bacterium]|nr:PEP-CTERM sorting domain-containing protein [Opitutales bacterium]